MSRSTTVAVLLRGTPAARINRAALALPGVPTGSAAPWHRPHHEVPGGYLVWIPGLELVSELNARDATWAQRNKRSSRQHLAVARALEGVPRVCPPCRVVVTRCAPRALDTDNLVGAAKYVRDEIALHLGRDGVDDADPRVEWLVRQEPPAEGVGVRIELVPRPSVSRTRVDQGAVTRVWVRLSREQRKALAEALTSRDPTDEVRVVVDDLHLYLSLTGGG